MRTRRGSPPCCRCAATSSARPLEQRHRQPQASALAGALNNQNLQTLEKIALDNNSIGDAGASSLFQRMSPNADGQVVLHQLKEFLLNND